MATAIEDLSIETKTKANINESPKVEDNNTNGAKAEETKMEKIEDNQLPKEQKNDENGRHDEMKRGKEEVVPDEVEPKTGVSFPVKLEDGKKLSAVGLRKQSMLGVGIKIYAFVKGEVVSSVESELLCRAFINMYLGADPFDKEAKEKFGMSLHSLF